MNFYCRTIISLTSCILLTSCIGPDFHTPIAPKTQSYTAFPLPEKTLSTPGPGGASQEFLFGKDISAQWWVLFESPEINELIERALKNNPNLQAAEATLRQAEQSYFAEVGNVLVPALNYTPYVSREKFSLGDIGIPPNLGITIPPVEYFNLYNSQVTVTYLMNFGMLREVESSDAQVEYQQFQLEATYLSLIGNIVTTAITQASLDAQIDATNQLIDFESRQLEIIEAQFQLGGASRINVLTQKTQLEQTRSLLPPLENNLVQTQNSLAILMGELPSEFKLPVIRLDDLHLPTELPVSLPSSLVRQRPDIRSAEAIMRQANAQVGIATANLLPQLNLNVNYGPESSNFQQLFENSNNLVWTITGQLTQPIMHGGALWANRKAAIEGYNQAAAKYRETVLTAFKNVADALKALEYDAWALQATVESESAAKEALELTQLQFKVGAVNYLALLIAEYQYQQAIIARIKAQASRYVDTAALFQALGGGWWNRDYEQVEI